MGDGAILLNHRGIKKPSKDGFWGVTIRFITPTHTQRVVTKDTAKVNIISEIAMDLGKKYGFRAILSSTDEQVTPVPSVAAPQQRNTAPTGVSTTIRERTEP